MPARPRSTTARSMAGAAVLGGGALLLSACGSSSSGAGAPSGGAGARTVEITLTPDGCAAPVSMPAGPTNFHVTNSGADAVTEFEVLKGDSILGEKENLAPGLDGSFSLSMQPGEYTAYCPGAGTERTTFTVTATTGAPSASSSGAVADRLTAATDGYAVYVKDQSAQLTRATTAFVEALKAGDVSRAKALYGPTRVFYERIEPVAESFGDLDPQIDAREGDVPAAGWGGFHRIEQILWVKGTTAGTAAYADKLLADVNKLETLVQTATYQPAQLANGATELLDEVARSKITGEEERYSHTDLVDFKANVDGSKQAYVLLVPALTVTDPELAATVTERFAAVEALLAQQRSGSGFKPYTALTKAEIRALAQSVDALAEPLSQVAGKVVVG